MPMEIVTLLSEIPRIAPAVIKAVEFISNLKGKAKKEDIAQLTATEEQINEIRTRLNVIGDAGWSINAYMVLYGQVLELYTAADDLIKLILSVKDLESKHKGELIEEGYYNVKETFYNGFANFLKGPARDNIDRSDEEVIDKSIRELEKLFGEGEVYVEGNDYEKLRKNTRKIAFEAHDLRGRSRERLLALIEKLQKLKGT